MRYHGRHGRQGMALLVAVAVGSLLLSACEAAGMPESETPEPEEPRVGVDAPAPPDGDTVTLAFAGDVHFEGGLADVPGRRGSTLGPMSRALRSADLAVVNLESALTGGGTQAPKELETPSRRYWFRSPGAALDVLDRSGVDVVSLANNHGADYGAAGLRDSLRIAEQSPVDVIGVGRDPDEAFRSHRVTIRGTDVAVLAADASPRESASPTWGVGDGTGPGLASARARSAPRLVGAVRRAAETDDVVVVYLHWGREYDVCPTGDQQRLARMLARAGADVVVGTHAHELQGAGMLGDTYVAYGLGNFYWYHGIRPESGVLRLRVNADGVVGDEWLPGQIPLDGGGARPEVGPGGAAALAAWRGLRGCTDLAPAPGAEPSTGEDGLPAFTSAVHRIGQAQRRRMLGSSHSPSCPVPIADLRRVAVDHVGFDGQARRGVMVVHVDVATDIVSAFASLYAARFPIRRMRLVDAYGGDDDRSMAANNTSGYNCRRVAGSARWSEHAYGRAVDINPVQNPYLVGGDIRPPAGRRYATLGRGAGATAPPGVIRDGDVVTRAFARLGWTWGGTWADPDYQHFTAP